jgi:hypothetical protein
MWCSGTPLHDHIFDTCECPAADLMLCSFPVTLLRRGTPLLLLKRNSNANAALHQMPPLQAIFLCSRQKCRSQNGRAGYLADQQLDSASERLAEGHMRPVQRDSLADVAETAAWVAAQAQHVRIDPAGLCGAWILLVSLTAEPDNIAFTAVAFASSAC